ncbi:MAG: hypothetical protein FWH40_07700 [Coriobacteriia bacterium]|nr:hypothetical protein [Coriobacteriia bacterium]
MGTKTQKARVYLAVMLVLAALTGPLSLAAYGKGEAADGEAGQAIAATVAAEGQRFQLVVNMPEGGGTFIVPTSSYLNGTTSGKAFNWVIDWGDGSTQIATGTSSSNGGVPHGYAAAGDYTITITPNGTMEAWLGAFGFNAVYTTGANSSENTRHLKAVIGPLTPEMTRTSAQVAGMAAPPDYEWARMFWWCTYIRQAPTIEGWEQVTSVGDSFAANMFFVCSNLVTIPESFNLPQNLTSAGDDFASNMFCSCANIVLPDGFNLPPHLSSVGSSFASGMFGACIGLRNLPDGFNLPPGITSVGDSFASSMFESCMALTSLPEGFNLPPGITSVGDSFASNMFESCMALTSLPEGFNLPPNIINAGNSFAYLMFILCNRLEHLPEGFNLPQSISRVGNDFATYMFFSCSSLEDLPDGFTIPQGITSVGNDFARNMFGNCAALTGLPAGFNLPAQVTEAGSNFAYELLYNAGSPDFQVNDEFCFPAGIPADSEGAFYHALLLSEAAPVQSRSAASVIGDCPEPSSARDTFSSSFADIDYIALNWGGGGKTQLISGSGDLNGDGVVTMDEVVTILQATVGAVELSPEQFAVIDMDFDQIITMVDVILALQRV